MTILHNNTPCQLTVNPDESIELLRHQIWSLTGVPLPEQSIAGLGVGMLREELNPLPVSTHWGHKPTT